MGAPHLFFVLARIHIKAKHPACGDLKIKHVILVESRFACPSSLFLLEQKKALRTKLKPVHCFSTPQFDTANWLMSPLFPLNTKEFTKKRRTHF